MSFGGYPVADIESFYFNATLDDLAAEFVSDGQRHWNRITRPVIPLIDMDVGASYCSAFDADQDIVVSDRGLIDILEPDAAFGLRFDECAHG